MTYQTWRDKSATIEGVAGFSSNAATIGNEAGAQRILGFRVTASFFSVLGVRPEHGGPFQEADEEQGRPRVIVLSNTLWRDRFGGDVSALAKTLELDGVSHQVVGVMPAGFAFPTPEAKFWVPLYVPPATPPADGSSRLSLFGESRDCAPA